MNKEKEIRKISCLTNRYPVQKTLCEQLIPVGRTLEHFENRRLLEEDQKRSEDYEKVKAMIDDYHKANALIVSELIEKTKAQKKK